MSVTQCWIGRYWPRYCTPAALVRWNIDKHYLGNLAAAGVPIVPTRYLERGGKLFALSDSCFRMPSDETPRIQEGHEFVGHLLCSLIEAGMFPRDGD